MGLIMYGFIYILTIVLIIDSRIISSRIFPLFWFTVMVCLSLSVRWRMIQSGQALGGGDISAYVLNMSIQDTMLSYHWREPVFWLGSQYLYQLIGNPGLVFVVMDAVLFLTFYKSVGLFQTFFPKPIKFDNVKYLYFGAFLVYPYMTGMHNHYRQILAVTVAMVAFGLAERKLVKALVFYLCSILIHNATILLFPIFLLARKRVTSFNLIGIGALAIILTLFIPSYYLDEIIRRFVQIGVRDVVHVRTEIYLYLLLLTTSFIIILEYTFNRRVQHLLIKVLISLTAIFLFGFVLFPNQGVSRIFFMVITLLYILIGLYIEVRFKTGPIEKLLYFHFSLIPLLGLRGDGLFYDVW